MFRKVVNKYLSFLLVATLLVASMVQSTTIYAVENSIKVAREASEGSEVTVEGIVTCKSGSKYIVQNGSYGIVVYDSSLTMVVGDSVKLTGSAKDFKGLAEIINVTSETIISSDNELPALQEITVAKVTEEVESERILIKNVTLGTINTGGSTSLTDANGNTINVWKIPELTEVAEGDLVNVYAYGSDYKGTYQLFVASADDVELASTNLSVQEALNEAQGTEVTMEGYIVAEFNGQHAIKVGDRYSTTDATIIVKLESSMKPEFSPVNNPDALGQKIIVTGTRDKYSLQESIEKVSSIEFAETAPDTEAPVITHTEITSTNINQDIEVLAQVIDNTGVSLVKLFYKTVGTDTYNEIEMSSNSGVYSATIPSEDTTIDGVEYYILATDTSSNTDRDPAEDDVITITITDEDITGPVIEIVSPIGVLPITEKRPEVVVNFSDTSGVNMATLTMLVDGINLVQGVTTGVTINGDSLSYTPFYDLTEGEKQITISVEDMLGNVSTITGTFYIGQVEYTPYFGQLHAHSTYSDGRGSGDEAYTQARYEGNADFFALTDHSNWFDHDTDNENITEVSQSTSETWKALNADADEHYVPGEFVAIAGYEMTWSGSTGGWGHINTFNTPWFASRKNAEMDLPAYYEKISQEENSMSISQLNHPGNTFGDFADFGYYSEEADAVVQLIEVGNGEGSIRGAGYFPSYEYYTRALDKGWHIAPSNNQDNHKGNFVISNEARTVVLGSELTREGIYDGIRNRRVYATEDSNLEISYTVNDMPMGTVLESPEALNIDIEVSDPDATDVIGKISIIGDGGYVVAEKEFTGNTADWELTLDPSLSYYYVRIDQGDKDIAVTAPVWAGEVTPIGISNVEVSENPTLINTEINVTATLYNNSTEMVNGPLEVKFYKDSVEEGNLISTQTVDSIGTGSTVDASFKWIAAEAGTTTIYAQVTMPYEGADKSFTNSVQVKVFNEDEAQIVLVDAGHQNAYISGSYPGNYTGLQEMMANNNLILRLNEDELTAEDFENVSALIITDPASTDSTKYGYTKSKYSDEEVAAIVDYINAGGNLILGSTADYKDGDGEYQNSEQGNKILEAINANLRLNDDELVDDENNEGKSYKFLTNNFVSSKYEIFDNNTPNDYRIYSGCSVILKENGNEANVDWLVKGNSTTYTIDADEKGDNVAVAKGDAYLLASEVLPSGAKIVVAGSTFFSDFEITGDNQYANTDITEAILQWVAPESEVKLVSISDIKLDEDNDGVLDLTGQKFAVEGFITSESEATSNANGRKNAFFEVIYVQDATGGITVFGVSQTDLPLGTKVRIEGTVQQYNHDGQLSLDNELEDLTILSEPSQIVEPTLVSTAESMLEANEGLLVKVEGTVTRMIDDSIYVNDGSGEARVFVEGYIGDGTTDLNVLGQWDESIQVGDTISAVGLASESTEGHRIRVRNTSEIVKVSEESDFTITRTDANVLANGSEARVEVEITNNTDTTTETTFILVLYDKVNSEMINYVYVTEDIMADETKTMAGGFLIPLEGSYEVKIFVWDNFENQNPLLDTPIEINVQ